MFLFSGERASVLYWKEKCGSSVQTVVHCCDDPYYKQLSNNANNNADINIEVMISCRWAMVYIEEYFNSAMVSWRVNPIWAGAYIMQYLGILYSFYIFFWR